MAAPRRERRPEETEQPLVPVQQRPPMIIPVRRGLEPVQERQLRQLHTRMEAELAEFTDRARHTRTTPEATARYITGRVGELRTHLRNLGLQHVPVMGESYQDEMTNIGGVLDDAERFGREGRLGEAIRAIRIAEDRMGRIPAVFERHIDVLRAGLPLGFRYEGMTPEQSFDAFQEGLQAAIVDPSSDRSRNILRVVRSYTDNAQLLNTAEPTIRRERDTRLRYVIVRGRQADAGTAYTRAQAEEDGRMVAGLDHNLMQIRRGMRQHNITVFRGWEAELGRLAAAERDETSRRMIDTVRTELQGILRRLQRDEEVSQDDLRMLSRRYFALTGRQEPLTEPERIDRLRTTATELRGSGRQVRDETPEWYGQRALELLAEGNTRLAALAVSMGLLERRAARAEQGARTYLPDYFSIHDAIANGRTLSPAMLSRFAGRIEVATLAAEIAQTMREHSGGRRPAEKRQRITLASEAARQRLLQGDVEGARRMLNMVSTYIDLLEENSWRTWAGSADMEGAIDAEITGENALSRFNGAVALHELTRQTAEFRRGLQSWQGRPMSSYRTAATRALDRAETLARGGDIRQAQRVLALVVMYAESVSRLGTSGRGGRITAVSSEDARLIGGMRRALGAMAEGRLMVDERQVETVFMESFNASISAHVTREADRLGRLASRRESGRPDITRALQTARERAQNNDFRGAMMLLQYVSEFYGRAGGGRREGWRYGIFTRRDAPQVYENGRREMLDSIRMEIDATTEAQHTAAAQLFESGTRRIAEAEALSTSHSELVQRYRGEVPFEEGRQETRGRLRIGQSETGQPIYLDLSSVRSYESDHPRDSAVRGQTTLTQLLRRCEEAARRGDIDAYTTARRAFSRRFDSIASRAARRQAITSMRSQLQDLDGFIRSLPQYESTPADDRLRREVRTITRQFSEGEFNKVELARRLASATARRDAAVRSGRSMSPTRRALLERRTALLRALRNLEDTSTPLDGVTIERPGPGERAVALQVPVLNEYASLIAGVERERRISTGLALVREQVELNGQYRRAVAGESGDLRDAAVARLDAAAGYLAQVQRHLQAGDFDAAERAYGRAVNERFEALMVYNAEMAANFGDMISAHRTRGGMRPDERFFPLLRDQRMTREFQPYVSMQTAAFRDLIRGSPSGDSRRFGERIQQRLRAATLIETSVFAVPADASSQFFSEFRTDQQSVRTFVSQGNLQQAERVMQDMIRRAERNRLIANVAVMTVGVATAFIPVVGIYISGSIFTGMAIDRIATEYRRDGHASTESWAILGLTVATIGFAGAASAFRLGSLGASAAGLSSRASMFMGASRAFTYTNLAIGAGFSLYAGHHAMQAFQAGRNAEGAIMLGFALFPAVHMIGARGVSSFRARTARARARAELELALSEIVPSEAVRAVEIETPAQVPEVATARRLSNPRELYRFMRDYVGHVRSGSAARASAMLEQLPASMRPEIASLSNNRVLLAELDAGVTAARPDSLAWRVLQESIGRFTIPTPPGGGGGPRSTIDVAGLVENPGALRRFLQDLLVPDTALEPALLSRSAARGRLAAIRETHPQVAAEIDRMITNPTLRNSLLTGETTPLSMRMMQRSERAIRDAIPREAVAAEMRAAVGYFNEVYGPRMMETGGAAPEGALGTRAMAGRPPGPGEATPVVQQPIPPEAIGSPRPPTPPAAPRPAAPREATPARAPPEPARPAEAAPEQAPPAQAAPEGTRPNVDVNVQVQPTVSWLYENTLGRVVGRWRASRARRAARAAEVEAPSVADIQIRLAQRVNDSASLFTSPAEMEGGLAPLAGAADAEAVAAVATSARTAEDRILALLRILDRAATAAGRRGRGPYDEAMLRIYAVLQRNPQARARIQALAAEAPAIRRSARAASDRQTRRRLRAMADEREQLQRMLDRIVDSASGAGGRDFLNRIGRVVETEGGRTEGGVRPEDIEIMIQAIERGPAARYALGRAVRDAQLALAEAQARGTGVRGAQRALTRAQQRFERGTGLRITPREGLTADQGLARLLAYMEQNAPMRESARLLGTEVNPAERARMILHLERQGVLTESALRHHAEHLTERVTTVVNSISTPDPVADAVRTSFSERIPQGGSIDDLLLASLRSDSVATAVRTAHGAEVETAFRAAVREGNLTEVLGNLPQQVRQPLSAFTSRMRSGQITTLRPDGSRAPAGTLGEHLQAIATIEPRARQIQGLDLLGFRGRARGGRMLREDGWVVLSGIGRGARWYWNNLLYARRYGAPRYVRGIMEAGRGGRARAATYGIFTRLLPHAGVLYLQYRAARWAYDRLHYRLVGVDIERGLRDIRRDFGPNAAPSRENALWIRSDAGQDFYAELNNYLPRESELSLESEESLREGLASRSFIYDPRRLGDIINDGRAMTEQLGRLNSLLDDRRSGTAEQRTRAERDLNAILRPWGITLEQVDARLGRRRTLNIGDMVYLRRDQWRTRRMVTTIADHLAESMCLEVGLITPSEMRSGRISESGKQAAAFLAGNHDAFVFLWRAWGAGHIPSSFMGEAITSLRTNYAELQGQVSDSLTIDEVLRTHLQGEGHNYYLTDAITPSSFLGTLDDSAVVEPSLRTPFRQLLTTHRGDAIAMAILGSFAIPAGERLYGNPADLANLILENMRPLLQREGAPASATETAAAAATALQTARQRGLIGPPIFAQIDPSLARPENGALIAWAMAHTSGETGDTQRGVVRWLRDTEGTRLSRGRDPERIMDLRAILQYLSSERSISELTAAQLYTPATGQGETARPPTGYIVRAIERFARQSPPWWSGPTPSDAAEAVEATRRGGGPTAREQEVRRVFGRGRRGRAITGLRPTRPPTAAPAGATIAQAREQLPQEFRDFMVGVFSEQSPVMRNTAVQEALRSSERFNGSAQALQDHVLINLLEMAQRAYAGSPRERAGRDRTDLRSFGITVSSTGEGESRRMQITWDQSRMQAQTMQTKLIEIITVREVRRPAEGE